MGGRAEKRADYIWAVLNLNFIKVSFSSRSNAKIIFKGREPENPLSVGPLGINPLDRKAMYSTLRGRNMKEYEKEAC